MAALCSVGLACAAAGCVSTQQKASWLHVRDARIIAAQSPTVVRTENPEVRVQRIWVLRDGSRAALVVRLRNLSDRTLSDLPISVGFTVHRKRIYLNRSANLGYFDAHLAGLRARQMVTWVFATRTRTLPTGRPFALVGPHPVPAVALGLALPKLRVSVAGAHGSELRVRVTNHSSVPQLGLPLYAFAGIHGRVTAAGQTTITTLGAGQTARIELGLIGHANSNLQLEALPTMFLP